MKTTLLKLDKNLANKKITNCGVIKKMKCIMQVLKKI